MTILALIRHGETDWNARGLIQGLADIPLNDTGIDQARSAAKELRSQFPDMKWAGLISSPLLRAAATGQVIAETLGIPIMDPMPQFAERDYGAMDGAEMTRAKALYPTGEYPESEHNRAVLERARDAINGLHQAHEGKSLIVVSHGGLLHTLLSDIHGSRVPSIQNATVNILEHRGGVWVIQHINNEEFVA